MLYITNVSQRLLYCCSWLWLSSFHNLFSKNQKSKSKIKSRPEIALLITAANFSFPKPFLLTKWQEIHSPSDMFIVYYRKHGPLFVTRTGHFTRRKLIWDPGYTK